jgi:hypothetical protein
VASIHRHPDREATAVPVPPDPALVPAASRVPDPVAFQDLVPEGSPDLAPEACVPAVPVLPARKNPTISTNISAPRKSA